MQLHKVISSDKSAVYKLLLRFKEIVQKDRPRVWCPKNDVLFVFLCGANIKESIPSKRRECLIKFSENQISHAKFFLAEKVFDSMEGYSANYLDVEKDLSVISDYVVIVLESESAFCELGAFAVNQDLRKKLVVINDKQFKSSKSFISKGPICAITESFGEDRILYYDMEPDGKLYGDGIAEVFGGLCDIMKMPEKKNRIRARNFDPTESITKNGLRFVYDLIYLMGPITFEELSRIIKILFERTADKRLRSLVALLVAFGEVEKFSKEESYYLVQNECQMFFEYEFDYSLLRAAFLNMYRKYDCQRLAYENA